MARFVNDAASEYFLVTGTSGTDVLPKTLFAWGLDDSGTNNDRCLFQVHDASQTDRFLRVSRNTSTAACRAVSRWDNAGAPTGATSGTIITNQWTAFAGEFGSATSKYAICDGVRGTEVTVDDGAPSAGQMDGAAAFREYNNNTGADYWSGGGAEMAVWDKVLDDAIHTSLSLGFSPIFFQDALSFYCSMSQPTGFSGDDQDVVGGLALVQTNTPTTIDHPPIIYPAGQMNYTSAGAAATGRIMSSLANHGGLAGFGGLAGIGGGLAG